MKRFTRAVLCALLAAVLLACSALPAAAAATPRDEAIELLQGVQEIFASGTFTLKCKNSSTMEGMPSSSDMLVVADQDKMAIQSTNNLGQMFMEGSGQTGWQSKFLAAMLNLLLGKTIRIVYTPETMLFMFPERRIYLDFRAAVESMGEEVEMIDISSIFDVIAFDISGLDFTTKTVGEYFCVTVDLGEGNTQEFYFLGKDLKRIVMTASDEYGGYTSSMEIESLVPTADQRYFSIKWMVGLDLMFFARIFGAIMGSSTLY